MTAQRKSVHKEIVCVVFGVLLFALGSPAEAEQTGKVFRIGFPPAKPITIMNCYAKNGAGLYTEWTWSRPSNLPINVTSSRTNELKRRWTNPARNAVLTNFSRVIFIGQ